MRAQGFWPKTKYLRDWRLVTFYSCVPWQVQDVAGRRTVWGPKVFRSLVTAGHSMDQPEEGRQAAAWRSSVVKMGLQNCLHVPVLRAVWKKCHELAPAAERAGAVGRVVERDREDKYRIRTERGYSVEGDVAGVFEARYGVSPARLEELIAGVTQLPFHIPVDDCFFEIDL
jgi:hypothetical protein